MVGNMHTEFQDKRSVLMTSTSHCSSSALTSFTFQILQSYRYLIPECRSTNASVYETRDLKFDGGPPFGCRDIQHSRSLHLRPLRPWISRDPLQLSLQDFVGSDVSYVYGGSCVRGWKRERVSLSFDFFGRFHCNRAWLTLDIA